MPRKDRLKVVTERCQQMAGLLRGLRASASVEDNARITEALEAIEEDISELRQTTAPSNPDTDTHDSQGSREFGDMDQHEELDTASLDLLDEDLHKDDRARATGFVGKNSEVQWLRAVAMAQTERVDDEAGGLLSQRRGSIAPGNEQVTSFSYWADGESVDIDFFVDPYELPQPETAERLLQCYMLRVHDSFPILPRKTFEDQFRKYFTALQNGNAPRLSPKWQAILNMVFAIGAKYSHLIKASWRADERDHLIYQARARAFGLNETTITTHSDVPQIQSLGLLAFYWLSVGQVNRAWTVIGIALRFAYSLGLHVRNEDPSATAAKRETLVRTWWSLYSLERTLSIVTGRPSIIVDSCCSVPLPMPVPEENISDDVEAVYRMRKGSATTLFAANTYSISSSVIIEHPQTPVGLGTADANSGSYFRAVVQLSIITQNILTSLYSAGTMVRPPGEVQQDMAQLGQRLDQWLALLPVEFNFQEPHNRSNDKFIRERLLLGLQLSSARMLLTRPCLSGRRQTWRECNEASFASRMANNCVEAAKTTVAFLPDEPRPDLLYDHGPWWCLTHHIMQAISVFLLGLSHPSSTSQDSMTLVHYLKKAIRWLQNMQDPVAERAQSVALRIFESVARRYSLDVSDLWANGFEERAAVRERASQQVASNTDIGAFLPAQFVTMAPPQIANPTITSHAVFEPVMAGGHFPPQHEAPVFNEAYYLAR